MTTPSPPSPPSSEVMVFGVLVDPKLVYQTVSSSDKPIHEAVQSLWETVNENTSEKASAIQVLLDTDLKSAASETTLPNLTIKDPQEYYVLFGMPPSWSYTVSKENKENVAGMDVEVGRKSTVPSKPLAAVPHDIESLRQELMGLINEQSSDIHALKTSNVKLTSSNAKLTSSNAKLTSSNTELKSKVNGLISSNAELTSSNAELKSKVNGLTSSNAKLLEKVNNLEVSNNDISSALKTHSRRIFALNRRLVLDDARIKLAKDYNFSLDEIRPRSFDLRLLVQQVQSRLSTEDAKLLSNDALTMIFDSSDNSMRDGAAHEASNEDRVDSVLEARLTNRQRALLGEIWQRT